MDLPHTPSFMHLQGYSAEFRGYWIFSCQFMFWNPWTTIPLSFREAKGEKGYRENGKLPPKTPDNHHPLLALVGLARCLGRRHRRQHDAVLLSGWAAFFTPL